MSVVGVQFVGHASHLWWDRVCDICKFWSARTSIKEALWGGALVALQQNCANQCIDAASERKKQTQDQWQAVKRFQAISALINHSIQAIRHSAYP